MRRNKLPRRKHRARGYLTHQQVELLASEVNTDATVIRFWPTPDCAGEMAALHIGDADMLRRRVHIRQAVAEVRGRLVWSTPKSHEQRSVPFPAFLANELAALMVGKNRDDLIFTAREGESCGSGLAAPSVQQSSQAAHQDR